MFNDPQPQSPAIPSTIPETQAAQMPNLDEAIHSAVSAINAPLPPTYVSGSVPSTPTIQPVKPYQPQNTNNQPLTNQATSIKEARRKNAYANIANVVGNAANNIQQKKQLELTNKIKDVMQAKQNIANAEIVLQNDPNNKQAQMVKAANMQRMNAILSDPKNVKQFEKAFDISFTDMEKNKTPEVSALLAAQKDVKNAGAFKYDNPQEAAVAMQASRSSIDANKDAQMAFARQPQGQPVASATPYADKVMSKDLPSIEKNSLYDAALKQRDALEQKFYQYVIPEMMRADIQAGKDQAANARANLLSHTAIYKTQLDNITKAGIEDSRAAALLKSTAMKDATQIRDTNLRVDAIKYAVDHKLAEQEKLKPLADTQRKTLQNTITNLTNQIKNDEGIVNSDTADNGQKAIADARLQNNNYLLGEYQKSLDKLNSIEEQQKKPEAKTDNTSNSGSLLKSIKSSIDKSEAEINATDQKFMGTNDASSITTEPIGSSESDEDSGNENDDDDINSYANLLFGQ